MTISPRLLAKTREAGSKLAALESEVHSARKEYHALVRRMHLAGGSLREIAQALELSHQRVQQIVDGAGGSWWQRMWRSRGARGRLDCTFCRRSQDEFVRLIAGPSVFICDACVASAEQALSDDSHGTAGDLFLLAPVGSRVRCSFCSKRRSAARPVLTGRGNICGECLDVCRQVLIDSR